MLFVLFQTNNSKCAFYLHFKGSFSSKCQYLLYLWSTMWWSLGVKTLTTSLSVHFIKCAENIFHMTCYNCAMYYFPKSVWTPLSVLELTILMHIKRCRQPQVKIVQGWVPLSRPQPMEELRSYLSHAYLCTNVMSPVSVSLCAMWC